MMRAAQFLVLFLLGIAAGVMVIRNERRVGSTDLGYIADRGRADDSETERVTGAGFDHAKTPDASILIVLDGSPVSLDELDELVERLSVPD